jgi:VanZ family protein
MKARPWLRYLNVILLGWLPLLAWLALIYWLSDQPKLPHPARRLGISDYLFDYTAHAVTFGILVVLFWRVLAIAPTPWPTRWQARSIEAAGLLAALYAVSDELHQRFVPGRWPSLKDLIADLVGVLLAVGALKLWQRWRKPLLRRGRAWVRGILMRRATDES